MRDTVAAIRHVIGNAHKGLSPYRGAYYNADFQELMLTAPPERENLPIWHAALRERLTDTALEIADGLIVHSLWSVDYTVQHDPPIASKLADFERDRSAVAITAQSWVAETEIRQA